MIHLILAIVLFVILVTTFRVLPDYGVTTFHVIVVNYMVCAFVGAIFVNKWHYLIQQIVAPQTWHVFAIILSFFFISGFYLLARATQTTGLATATISSRLSMIIPVLVSMFLLNKGTEITFLKVFGIIMAFPAMFLIVARKPDPSSAKLSFKSVLLPIGVFFTGGLIDTIINYTNKTQINSEQIPIFPILTFASAALIGLIVLIFNKSKITRKEIVAGSILGTFNYFSIFFLLKALEDFNHNGAYVFPILNISGILINTLLGVTVFSEKMNNKRLIGVGLAIAAIVLIHF